MAHWQTLWLGDMTPAQMRKFILFQNTYSYDGEEPVWHTASELARFCDLEPEHPKYPVFRKVWSELTLKHCPDFMLAA